MIIDGIASPLFLKWLPLFSSAMDTPEKNMDWDKLLDALESNDNASLNEEEMAMWQAAREMKQRTQTEQKFPVEAGWQQFQAARRGRHLRVVWRKRLAAAAAVAAFVAGIAIWWRQDRRADKPAQASLVQDEIRPVDKVRIRLSNGKTITLDSTAPAVQNNNGSLVKLKEDGIVYQAETGRTANVQQFDSLFVPRGNKIHITLADGTGVWVNADSKLVYPASFGSATREVWVEGEAFFDVAQHPKQPFVVHAKDVAVNVLGTSFNVNTYDANIRTTLTSGKISASASRQRVVLTPGQQASYNIGSGILLQLEVDTRIFTSWKDGDVYFEEADLATIVRSLGRSFDYDFEFEDPSLEKLSFTLDMRNPTNIRQVLDYLSLTNQKIKFQIKNRTVLISRVH